MEPLDPKEVSQIAHLAHLALPEDELEQIRGELSSILQYMEALAGVDTSHVEPMTHAVPMNLRVRPDSVAPSLPVETVRAQAPDFHDDHFRVPHIIHQGNE